MSATFRSFSFPWGRAPYPDDVNGVRTLVLSARFKHHPYETAKSMSTHIALEARHEIASNQPE